MARAREPGDAEEPDRRPRNRKGPQDRPGSEGPDETDGIEEGAGEPVVPEPTPLTQQLGRIFIVILAALFGVFAVANSQPVDFSWVFGETEVRADPTGEGTTGGVPLIVLLLITVVIGALVGAYLAWQIMRARRARRDTRT